jgi:eukaryotic-like serine/threonine-protein kinase
MQDNAAHNLLGHTLGTGWKVIEKITKPIGSTGSFFSVCYKVEKDDEICFLKAFDFAKFQMISDMEDPGRSRVDIIGDMIKAYQYERDLSELCRNRHVTKVAFVKEAGEETVNGFTYSFVPYLIFDLADGDVRSQLSFTNKLDFAWKMGSLHDIAVGLKQLHYIDVSHQDLKPSNLLLFNKKTKLGDLGRALCKELNDGPYRGRAFTGDNNYAPPEIMYGYFDADWYKRVYATDCYLLGSMVVFYIAGISMSALLMSNIPENFRVDKWRGGFEEVKPYILDAFTKSLCEFEKNIDNDFFRKELKQIVEHLCYPMPEKRGHPKNIITQGSNFNLERFVSKFDYLHEKAEYFLKR